MRIGSMVSNDFLNFEEIEAFGSSGELLTASTATMSSVYSSTCSTCTYGAEICIDGNIDGVGCHSEYKDNSDWFRVDYGAAVAVSKIAITTRYHVNQKYADRIAGATVTLSHDADGKQVVWAGILEGSQDIYTFTFELQTLPPNTAIVLVADVAGTTLANDAYWAKACTNIPSTAIGITVDMGAVRDFFKPTEGNTFCEMLQASNKHQWSANGIDWVEIDFNTNSNLNGGSAGGGGHGRVGDKRSWLSIWGTADKLSGGCCSSSTAISQTRPSLSGNPLNMVYTNWGQSFTMSYIYEKMDLDRTMKLSTLLVQKTKTKSEDDGTGTFWTGTVHNGAQLGAGRLPGFPQALTFNGEDQYVSIDGGVTIGGGPLSICVWAKWTKFNSYSKVIDIGNGADNGAILLYNVGTTSTLAFVIRGRDLIQIDDILQLGAWTHICGTFDSSGTMAVFVNGIKKKSGESFCDRLLRADAFIGRPSKGGDYFHGSISDLTIMDGHAITSDEEATEIMRSSGIIRTMALSELESDGTKTYSEPTVTGIWHGTVHNGAVLGPGGMPGSKALTFNGEDQYVSVDGGVTVGGGAFTACARAKWTEFKRYSRVVDLGNGVNSDMIYFGNDRTTNTLMFYIRHAGPTGSGTNRMISIDNILKKGEWIHICASVDTSATMTIHVNGVMEKCTSGNACDVSSGTGDGWVPKRILRTNAYIGKSNWDSTYFVGSISDFTLIDGKAVTAAEARAMMDATGTTTTATTSKTTTTTTTTIPTAIPGDACTTSRDCTSTPCKNDRCCRSDVVLACTSCDDGGFCNEDAEKVNDGATCESSSQCKSGPCKERCCKADDVECDECDDGGFCAAGTGNDAAKTNDGSLCSSSTECKSGPCKERCCKADDTACNQCDSGGFCANAFQSDGNLATIVDESKCDPGEEYDATSDPMCTLCQPGTTMVQSRSDICEPCTSDEGVEFTIRGNVGPCSSLVTLERLAAASAAAVESGGLNLGAKIGIPLSIIGFIGGIAIGWYRLKSDKDAKEDAKEEAKKAKEEAKETLEEIRLEMLEGLKKKKKKDSKKKKKKTSVKEGKSTGVTKANPMFETDDGGLYDLQEVAVSHKCGWTSAAGRTCAQPATNMHCDRHMCTNPDCTNGKESAALICDNCDAGAGGFDDAYGGTAL